MECVVLENSGVKKRFDKKSSNIKVFLIVYLLFSQKEIGGYQPLRVQTNITWSLGSILGQAKPYKLMSLSYMHIVKIQIFHI